jgi:predicted RNA-binding Zn ribbon-like protein
LVNTEVEDFGIDELRTPADLRAWAADRLGLRIGTVGEHDHARVLRARAGLRDLLLANNEVQAADRGLFAEVAATVTLGVEPQGQRFALVPRGTGVDLLLGRVLAEVVAAQHEGSWPRLKACRMAHCGWAFYDTSRNRSGRWCSARICGSRQAARDYRARHRDS